MEEYGALSLVPPILTIIVALYSHNVLFALTCGIFSGSLIIVGYNPFAAVLNVVENQILEDFEIYPNPNNGSFEIKMSNISDKVEIEILTYLISFLSTGSFFTLVFGVSIILKAGNDTCQ